MTGFSFRPAMTGLAPIFVMLAGGTNTGKSWSSLLLARGLVGPTGRIAAIDTEGGRLSSLARHHRFDMRVMQPPFHPLRFADAAEDAEADGYDCLVIDSFSMMHVGPGGYHAMHEAEMDRLAKGIEANREKMSWPAWRHPVRARQDMLYSLLQRRIPIIFACRATERTKKEGVAVVKDGWHPVCHASFPFEVTVSFTLTPEAGKGVIRHQTPFKLERDHEAIFKDGDVLTEAHGAALGEVMRRQDTLAAFEVIRSDGKRLAFDSIEGWAAWWDRPLRAAQPDALRALREGNGALMGAYAGDHAAAVLAVQHKIAVALGEAPATDAAAP